MLSECKRDFEDAKMSHKIDKLLQTVGLFTEIDAISDLTGDSETPLTSHPPHFPYKNTKFMTILDSVSIIT
jgi:hypothetical protein